MANALLIPQAPSLPAGDSLESPTDSLDTADAAYVAVAAVQTDRSTRLGAEAGIRCACIVARQRGRGGKRLRRRWHDRGE
jgi:hypothetical protein